MRRIFQLAVLLGLASSPALAANWSGPLVDSKCFEARQRNRNPFETHPASTDVGEAIRYCSPKAKTKSFGVVQPDGTVLKLDSGGNEKARQLILKAGKAPYKVEVAGEKAKNTIKVDTISVAQ